MLLDHKNAHFKVGQPGFPTDDFSISNLDELKKSKVGYKYFMHLMSQLEKHNSDKENIKP